MSSQPSKCAKCNKRKSVLIMCPCGKHLCLNHHVPGSHNCERILQKEETVQELDKIATGAFKKIDKI